MRQTSIHATLNYIFNQQVQQTPQNSRSPFLLVINIRRFQIQF